MLPTLLGKSKIGRTELVEQGSKDIALLAGDWKYIPPFNKNLNDRLYNLKDDIGETKNLANENPKKLADMKATLKKIENNKLVF